MSSSAWAFQKSNDVRDLGEDKAPWYVGWYEPDGRRKAKAFGAGFQGKKRAERFKNKVEDELMSGSYHGEVKKLWTEFREEYRRRVLEGLAVSSRNAAEASLDAFERIVKPKRVLAISTRDVDDFAAARRQEPGHRETISPATVNKDLRHVKAALNMAHEWGYLPRKLRFRMEREPKKLATYVPPEDFARLYQACDGMRWPDGFPFTAAEWWRGFLVTAYMTGWRVGQLLAIRRADVDLDDGSALSRADDNKGKRDQKIPLHPLIVEHLRRLACFEPCVFPWNHNRRQLFEEFEALQQAAGVKPLGKDRYGFHDLRRAFATMNADLLTADALQALMQHKDYQTTQRYINMARQLKPAVQTLFVPDLGPRPAGNVS
jgi:integrase